MICPKGSRQLSLHSVFAAPCCRELHGLLSTHFSFFGELLAVLLNVCPAAAHFPNGFVAKRALRDFASTDSANEARAAARRQVHARTVIFGANNACSDLFGIRSALAKHGPTFCCRRSSHLPPARRQQR